ncbi:HPr kinase/phosphorylase [Rhizorhabdus sp.]|uniref:HPr kinase/phosphorylase n=1 Tax=Rhizorhabdus sp. TaxID=1968843 RepID=UPI0035B437A5
MTTYRSTLYGLTIESPFPLPGAFPLADGTAADVTITWEAETAWRTAARALPASSDGPGSALLGETEDGGLCIEWRRELQLVIAPSNDHMTVICTAAKLEFVPTVLVGIGLGLLLHRRGITCLHGSVVSVHGRTIALLGDSGAGKSTTAAALVAQGGILVSDDIAALRANGDRFIVARGCANVRLDPEASARIVRTGQRLATAPWVDKLLWDVSGDSGASLRPDPHLDALYLLKQARDGDAVTISPPLPAAQALPKLVDCWYPQGFIRLLTQARFDGLRTIAERVPMFELSFPRRWDILPQITVALGIG